MYKRFLVLFLCLAFSGLRAFSQHHERELFSQSAGFTGFGGVMGDYSPAQDYTGFGFTYSPRLNFAVLSPSSSFSFGTHISAGFSTSSDGDTYVVNGDQSQVAFMLDVPLVVEYNFGNAATRNAFKKWGFFVGGGYGWHLSQIKLSYYDNQYGYGFAKEDLHVAGPVFNAGMRFPIALASLGIRFSYQVNNSNPGVLSNMNGIFGFGVEYNFGARTRPRGAARNHRVMYGPRR